MSFWGIEVKPGEPYSYHFDNVRGKLRATQATLGIGSSTERSILQCSVRHNNPICVCSLLPDVAETCPLNLEFTNELVVFSVIGPRSIHLCGCFEYSDYGEEIVDKESNEFDEHDNDDDGNFINDDADLEMPSYSHVLNVEGEKDQGLRTSEIGMDLEKQLDHLHLTADSELAPLEMRDFNDHLKSIIWLIKLTGMDLGCRVVRYATGFSIDSDGSILTSAELLVKMKGCKIRARRLDENNFQHKAKKMFVKGNWNLALLKIDGVVDCPYGKFVDDGSLSKGQPLFYIGHPETFVGSFLVGHVAYPCVNDVNIPTDIMQQCSHYQSTALNTTPPFRVLGDVWTSDRFAEHVLSEDDLNFEMNLHPLVPIIQCAGLITGLGCAGGPIFNSEGHIVGLLGWYFDDDYEIAIHVSILKAFLDLAKCQDSRDEGCSKRVGGPSQMRR